MLSKKESKKNSKKNRKKISKTKFQKTKFVDFFKFEYCFREHETFQKFESMSSKLRNPSI